MFFEEMGVPYAPRLDPAADSTKEKSAVKASSGSKIVVKTSVRKEKTGSVKNEERRSLGYW